MSNEQDPPNAIDFDAAISGDLMTIAKFQTKSCVVCRRLDPGLKAMAGQLADKLALVDVDAEENASVAERYNIQSVPTLILFKRGAELDRCSGFQSTNMLRAWIAPYLDA